VATPPPGGAEQQQEESPKWAIVLGFIFLIALVVLGVIVLYRIYPAHIAHKRNPGWLDLIFASPLVIFAGRLLLLSIALVLAFASAFTILSVVSWSKHRQWLTKAGPFEVSRDAIETLTQQVEFWQQQAIAENEEAQELRNRLADTEELLDSLLTDSPEEGTP
jgi:hypothetical protein